MERTASSAANVSAATHGLTARAELMALHQDVTNGAGGTPLEVTVLLSNLAAMGAVLPKTFTQLASHLDRSLTFLEPGALETPEGLERAFITQVAQHYLDQAATASREAQHAIESAMAALSSLEGR